MIDRANDYKLTVYDSDLWDGTDDEGTSIDNPLDQESGLVFYSVPPCDFYDMAPKPLWKYEDVPKEQWVTLPYDDGTMRETWIPSDQKDVFYHDPRD